MARGRRLNSSREEERKHESQSNAARCRARRGLARRHTSLALAGGNGATAFTQTDHNATDSFVDVVPCTGAPATVNLTYNDVFHGTINKTGSWFTGTMTRDVVATTLDANPITYTGHFTTWFGDENNVKNDVEHSTFNIHLTGSDGSTLSAHENAQAAMNANGTITVSFDHMVCN